MEQQELVELVGRAGFVFVGRQDAGASGEAPMVEVLEVLRGTAASRGLTGRRVRVTADLDWPPDDGDSAVLFTRVTSLGAEVEVSLLGILPAHDDDRRDVDAAIAHVEQERPLVERVAQADLVVTGQVVGTEPAEPDAVARSEHDPLWRVARVAVEGTLKGRTRRKQIEVLYASSMDVAWYRSPKFQEGDTGTFLLHSPVNEEPAAAVAARARTEAYVCDHPLDFQPADRLELVTRLVDTERGEG